MTDGKFNNSFGKVAVLLGGNSGEREVSLRSGAAVVKALKSKSVDVTAIDTKSDFIPQLMNGQFDRVFIALHGKQGEDGVIQGLLEILGMPYTGSGVSGSAIGMDKLRSKQIWKALGMPVIPAETVMADKKLSEQDASQILTRLGSKVMVKPAQEGSSLGISKAETVQELLSSVQEASGFGDEIIIEKWINGPEYTVSILNGKALPTIRIQPAREFYDYQAKYAATGTEYFCPAGLEAEKESQLKKLALQAFEAIHCEGWGRIDFIADKSTGEMYLLEANTVPGMTETSLVPMAAKAVDISFEDLVTEILNTADPRVDKFKSSGGNS